MYNLPESQQKLYISSYSQPQPKIRLTEAPPFTVTEVDFEGPLYSLLITIHNTKTFQFTNCEGQTSKYGSIQDFLPRNPPWYEYFWDHFIDLRRTLSRSYVTLQPLQTIITEMEGIIKHRRRRAFDTITFVIRSKNNHNCLSENIRNTANIFTTKI